MSVCCDVGGCDSGGAVAVCVAWQSCKCNMCGQRLVAAFNLPLRQ